MHTNMYTSSPPPKASFSLLSHSLKKLTNRQQRVWTSPGYNKSLLSASQVTTRKNAFNGGYLAEVDITLVMD